MEINFSNLLHCKKIHLFIVDFTAVLEVLQNSKQPTVLFSFKLFPSLFLRRHFNLNFICKINSVAQSCEASNREGEVCDVCSLQLIGQLQNKTIKKKPGLIF